MKRALLAALFLCFVGTAHAQTYGVDEPNEQNVVRIQFSPGGSVGAFIKRFIEIKNSGARVIIDGPCISACTFVLALVDNARVCATHRAFLAFHSAAEATGEFSEAAREVTRIMWHMYPRNLRDWLLSKGWNGDGTTRHSELIFLEAADLHRFVRPCTEEEA